MHQAVCKTQHFYALAIIIKKFFSLESTYKGEPTWIHVSTVIASASHKRFWGYSLGSCHEARSRASWPVTCRDNFMKLSLWYEILIQNERSGYI